MSHHKKHNVDHLDFEALVIHLHDDHGLNAEVMARDEELNETDESVIEQIRSMTREEALERLPYHYFMDTSVSRDSAEALASARITHDDDHANWGE